MAKQNESEEETANKKGGLLSMIFNAKNIFIALLTVFTAYNTYRTQVTKNELSIQKDQIDNNAAILDMAIKQKTFDNDLKFRMYGEVKDARVQKDSSVQNVVALIVNEMLADDSLFRNKLQNILLTSALTDKRVKERIVAVQKTENKFENENERVVTLVRSNASKFVWTYFSSRMYPSREKKPKKCRPH